MVLILAQSSPRVASYVDRAQVLSAWDKCQDILSTLSVMSVSIQKSLRLLQTLNDAVQQSASSHEQQQVGGTAPERDGVAGASQAAFLMNPYAMIDVPDMVDMDVVEAALVSWDQEMEFGFDFSALG
jgi:hypothetical protein